MSVTKTDETETKTNSSANGAPRKRSNAVKNKLNIVCRGYVKDNKAGGEIISVVPDVPISVWLDDLLVIFTIPAQDQPFAPTYIRLQDKSSYGSFDSSEEEVKKFTSDIRVTGYLKQKRGEIIVCAPKTHVKVDLSQIVIIATIPGEDKDRAPCYFKPKTYKFKKPSDDAPVTRSESDDTFRDSGDDVNVDDVEIPSDDDFLKN